MTTKELQTINSVLKNKDIDILFGRSVDDLFVTYGDVWGAIKDYHNKYRSIPDVEVIMGRFPDFEEVDVKADSSYYLEGLKAEYIKKRVENILMGAGKTLTESNSAEILNKLQTKLTELNRFSDSARDSNVLDMTAAQRRYQELKAIAEANGGVPGLPTGIDFIDSAYTSGLAGGDLVVVLGWTGRAKSLFTTKVMCNVHALGRKPMIVSLEMSEDKLQDRVLTIMGNGTFTNSGLSRGEVDSYDLVDFETKLQTQKEFIVVTDDGGQELTPNVVQSKIDQHKPDILVFDYAQLATDNANSPDMVSRMRNMSREFKRLAVNNNIPIMLISSATADSTAQSDSPPTISQVAWSRQLAFDADLAFAVHKHDDSNIVEIVCRKNRNGPLFSGYLDWDIDRGICKEVFDA